MKFSHEIGDRSLGMYVEHEHVKVFSDLLSEIIKQITVNAEDDDMDVHDVGDHCIAGMLKLFIEGADASGYHMLMYDLQELSVKYGLSHKTSV
tara:strand:+ start:590 stop:868 length:279 start_codon:yes stop_codon:yes gene_type:complete